MSKMLKNKKVRRISILVLILAFVGIFGFLAHLWSFDLTARPRVHPTIFLDGVQIYDGMEVPYDAVLNLFYEFTVPYGSDGDIEIFLHDGLRPRSTGFVDVDVRDSEGRNVVSAALYIGADASFALAFTPRDVQDRGFSLTMQLPVTLPEALPPYDEEDEEDGEDEEADYDDEWDYPGYDEPQDDDPSDDDPSDDDAADDDTPADDPTDDLPSDDDQDSPAEDAPSDTEEDTPTEDESAGDETGGYDGDTPDDSAQDDSPPYEEAPAETPAYGPPADEPHIDEPIETYEPSDSGRSPFRLGLIAHAASPEFEEPIPYYTISFWIEAVLNPDEIGASRPARLRIVSGDESVEILVVGGADFEAFEDIDTDGWDSAFLVAVRNLLNIPYPDPITQEDVDNRTQLLLPNAGLQSLRGIEYFTNLEILNIDDNDFGNLDLSALGALEHLSAVRAGLTSITLPSTNTLGAVALGDNRLTSLNLAGNSAIVSLYLAENELTTLDISGIADLVFLTVVHNYFADLFAITGWDDHFPDADQITGDYREEPPYAGSIQRQLLFYPQRPDNGNGNNGAQYVTGWTPAFEAAILAHAGFEAYSAGQILRTTVEAHANLTLNNVGLNTADVAGIKDFTGLQGLWLWENNISSIDVSANTQLRILNLAENNLTTINVSALPLLERLALSQNQLTSITFGTHTSLYGLFLADNLLTALDVSGFSSLWSLLVPRNNFASPDAIIGWEMWFDEVDYHGAIPVPGDLNYPVRRAFEFYRQNQIPECGCDPDIYLDTRGWNPTFNAAVRTLPPFSLHTCPSSLPIADVTAHQILNLQDRGLTGTAGLENFTGLRELRLTDNNLTDINLRYNTDLVILGLMGNSLSTIDLSQNTALEVLSLNDNNLTTLDLSQQTVLIGLFVRNNQLRNLDITNTDMWHLDVVGNYMEAYNDVIGWSDFFEFPDWTDYGNTSGPPHNLVHAFRFHDQYPLPDDIDTAHWHPDFAAAVRNLPQFPNAPAPIPRADVEALTQLNLENLGMRGVNPGLEYFTGLQELRLNGNEIGNIDLSRNTQLRTLNLSDNGLSSLSLRQNTMLETLFASYNRLTTLDVSQNTALRYVILNYNELDLIGLPNINPVGHLTVLEVMMNYLEDPHTSVFEWSRHFPGVDYDEGGINPFRRRFLFNPQKIEDEELPNNAPPILTHDMVGGSPRIVWTSYAHLSPAPTAIRVVEVSPPMLPVTPPNILLQTFVPPFGVAGGSWVVTPLRPGVVRTIRLDFEMPTTPPTVISTNTVSIFTPPPQGGWTPDPDPDPPTPPQAQIPPPTRPPTAQIISGQIPPGLTLRPDGTLQGIPTTRGIFRFLAILPDGTRGTFILRVLENAGEGVANASTPGFEFSVPLPGSLSHAQNITIASRGSNALFTDLLMNGVPLVRGFHYTHEAGASTAIHLNAQAFNDHAWQGENTIAALFMQGGMIRVAAQSFTLQQGNNPPPQRPSTPPIAIPPNATVLENAFLHVPMNLTIAHTNTPSPWAAGYVETAIEAGLVPANMRNRYRSAMTRADFAHLADALFSRYTRRTVTGRMWFSDTNDIRIQRMAYLGIMDPAGRNTFNPNGFVTRQEAAVMLSRLSAAIGRPLPPGSPIFTDTGHITAWAFDAVGQVQAAGLMGAVDESAFEPGTVLTRESGIVIMMRLLTMR